mgnify:CR=1 FL=1
MPVVFVVGAQWGDEGKGKIIDMLAEKMQMVVRYSGGDNAGHTVINPLGKFQLHLIPSGIFYPEVDCIIGNGVVVNPEVLVKEREELNFSGIDTSRLYISDRAHLIMPYHTLIDRLEEEARGGKALGTTLRGVGPAFTDKTARMGIRAGELLDKEALKERLAFVLEYKNRIINRVYGAEPLAYDDLYQKCLKYARQLGGHIKETTSMLEKAIKRDDKILFEGAQGALLDPDFGTYPYTTSSSPLAGNGCLGAGIGPTQIDRVMGVYKAYCTRVGAGPMPTELCDEMGDLIREKAQEYGTTTGRPRRCGWFDVVAARFSRRVNGLTGMAITRFDILDDLPAIKIAIGYRLDGKEINYFPASAAALQRCQPIYEELEGWKQDTSEVRDYDELPRNARSYLERLEELVGCPVDMVCVGPEREQAILKRPLI